jgi:hypothetical protein
VGLLVAVAVVGGAAVWLLGPSRPALLPANAEPLALRTQPWRAWPPTGFGCGMAALTPIRVERDGTSMVFADEASGNRLQVVWPNGYSAWLMNDRAELVPPNGVVLAREGDVISNLSGNAADNGDILICFDLASKPMVERSP